MRTLRFLEAIDAAAEGLGLVRSGFLTRAARNEIRGGHSAGRNSALAETHRIDRGWAANEFCSSLPRSFGTQLRPGRTGGLPQVAKTRRGPRRSRRYRDCPIDTRASASVPDTDRARDESRNTQLPRGQLPRSYPVLAGYPHPRRPAVLTGKPQRRRARQGMSKPMPRPKNHHRIAMLAALSGSSSLKQRW
jgi:hypothetical protein